MMEEETKMDWHGAGRQAQYATVTATRSLQYPP